VARESASLTHAVPCQEDGDLMPQFLSRRRELGNRLHGIRSGPGRQQKEKCQVGNLQKSGAMPATRLRA